MLEKLILYFVCKTKGHITKTQLVKFLYLADLYAVKWTARQLTELDWCYYSHGPWEQGIDEALIAMSKDICCHKEGDAIMIGVQDTSLFDAGFDFSPGLELILENIRKEWAGSGKLSELLDYVYATAPMIEAKKKFKPEHKAPLNLFLEREKVLKEIGA
ncbi:MAG: type II toxin-antitoxin system antitoxin SocA domain-containing protein [Cyanobacteria bacterium J06643_4]